MVAALAVALIVIGGCSASGEKKLTSADLSKAMPTAEDVGAGFRRDRAGEKDTNDGSELKVSAKCEKLLNDDDDEVKAKRDFKDDKERQIDTSATVTEDTLASLEKAAESCARIPFTSGSTKGTITIKVTPSKGIGEDSDSVDLVLSVTDPVTLTIKGHGVLSKRGNVGMSVIGLDGVDGQGTVTPIDNATVDKAARTLDENIKAAQS